MAQVGLVNLVAETTSPAPLLRQVEALEAERESLVNELASAESDKELSSAIRDINPTMVRGLLRNVAESLEIEDQEAVKDFMRQVVESVALDGTTFDATITYHIAPAAKAGEPLASPRGFEPRYLP